MNEGVIKIDLGRMLTKISGAIGWKQDPKMRQELLNAFEDDIKQIMVKHNYVVENQDHGLSEADFYNIEPSNIGGMGPISLPGVDNVGSGDIPAGVGSAEDRYEDELKKRKKKKKKKSVVEFKDFLEEQEQQKPFEPKQSDNEKLGEGDYEKGPANDPDAEMRERAASLKRSRSVATFKEFRKI